MSPTWESSSLVCLRGGTEAMRSPAMRAAAGLIAARAPSGPPSSGRSSGRPNIRLFDAGTGGGGIKGYSGVGEGNLCDVSKYSSDSSSSVGSTRAPSPWSPDLRHPSRERCGCCSKEDFWALFDVFDAMDRGGVGAVSRADFFWALKALGHSAEFQKALNKAALSAHFHKTARELPLESFVRRALRTATEQDIACMLRWANVRKAHNMVKSTGFKATRAQLQRAFELLDQEGTGCLAANELVHARLLSPEDLPSQNARIWMLSFDQFCGLLLEKYWRLESPHSFPCGLPLGGCSWPEEAAETEAAWREAVQAQLVKVRGSLTRGAEEPPCSSPSPAVPARGGRRPRHAAAAVRAPPFAVCECREAAPLPGAAAAHAAATAAACC